MRSRELIRATASFARARWGPQLASRAALETWQQQQLTRWMQGTLPRAAFYTGRRWTRLAELPIVDKQRMLDDFASFNTAGITLAEATTAAETGPLDDDAGLSFGLSSGTSGPRGVFMASAAERATWAGIFLARTLPPTLLKTVLSRPRPLRVALVLRANNRLYTTVAGRRLRFGFFDLMNGIDVQQDALQAFDPEVLVAPPSVLSWLATETLRGRLRLRPTRIISAAEVLESDDIATVRAAFDRPVHQVYQCTEGFLASTCEAGTLHLNEDFVHVEPQWLDAGRTRFTPIVTDFMRTTQVIARYRLDDVLRSGAPCGCGSPLMAIDAIEGRCDDVLWRPSTACGRADGPIFPDAIRHAIVRGAAWIEDYRIAQCGDVFRLAVRASTANATSAGFDAIRNAVDALIRSDGLIPPRWQQAPFEDDAPGAKRRRIRGDGASRQPLSPNR